MDIMALLGDFVTKAVDAGLVLGIVLFVAGLRWALKGFKGIALSDGVWRLMTLCLGVACAFIKLDYRHSLPEELLELLGKAFAYGGAATLFYQLYRVAAKKIFPPEASADPGKGP
jgi:hypothetical protein